MIIESHDDQLTHNQPSLIHQISSINLWSSIIDSDQLS